MPHIEYKTVPTKTVVHKTHCCAVLEIDYLSISKTPLEAMKMLSPYIGNAGTPAFLMFTGVVGEREFRCSHDGSKPTDYGPNFANFIVENGLGVVTTTEPRRNWTRNMVQVWIWSVDHTAFSRFRQDVIDKIPTEPVVEVSDGGEKEKEG